MVKTASARLTLFLSRYLPRQEITWMRGETPKSIGIGTQGQLMAIGSAALVAGWLGVATTSMIAGDGKTDAVLAVKQAELSRMQYQLAAMKSETAALRGDVVARAESLEARQAFLAALLSPKRDMKALAAMLPRASQGNGISTIRELVALPAAKRGKRGAAVAVAVAPAVDLAEPFRAIESQQLAFVDKAASAAEAKLRDTQALIRRLGLDPARFVPSSDWNGGQVGVGGPYIPVAAEPRFKDLFMRWKKLDNLQAAVAAIPAFMPVKDYRYTSSYGVRYDPFNGATAMHAGIDMAGAHGEPIYASADGTVLRAGRNAGYGNLVELSHGRGIDTRYGHLASIAVQPGAFVRQGQLIGRMGSTGRSTGTHLHFEVRVDGRAVNPRPFLDASAYVLAAQGDGATYDGARPQDFGPSLAPMLDDDTVTASATVTATGSHGAPMTPIRAYR